MDPTTTAAALAAASALAAYVNAKYHVAQDIKTLKFKRSSTKYYEQLGMHLPHVPFIGSRQKRLQSLSAYAKPAQ